MVKRHENYKELVWRLAKTDFKLRYHGSVLGYIWVILKPLLMFTILLFVFSSIFNFRNSGTPDYPLELLTALLIFQFFSEGTIMGMTSLVSKAQLVTKIYVPRWTIILGSTLNALLIFIVNLVVLSVFFMVYHKLPSLTGILMFVVYMVLLYILILAVSFLTAPFFVRFRDLGNTWDIILSIFMYASPIIYPLTLMPENIRQIMLLNPFAYIVHFSKQGLINNTFGTVGDFSLLLLGVIVAVVVAFLIFRKYEKKVAELI